jgi:hypothetical protein
MQICRPLGTLDLPYIYICNCISPYIYTSRCSKKNKRLMYPNKADAVVISLSYSWRLPPPACRSRWRLLIIAACLYINAPRRRTSWQQQLLVYMCINYTCIYIYTHTHTHTHTHIYIYIYIYIYTHVASNKHAWTWLNRRVRVQSMQSLRWSPLRSINCADLCRAPILKGCAYSCFHDDECLRTCQCKLKKTTTPLTATVRVLNAGAAR